MSDIVMAKAEALATPPAFRDLLIGIARTANVAERIAA